MLRYDRIRSRHIEWSTHGGAKGLVRVNDLINKYADDNVISVRLRIMGSPRRAVLMLRRLESQCTGGARESEEVKVKGGKREGGRINGMCNFSRDVPAGVHVHDYRRTGERD